MGVDSQFISPHTESIYNITEQTFNLPPKSFHIGQFRLEVRICKIFQNYKRCLLVPVGQL